MDFLWHLKSTRTRISWEYEWFTFREPNMTMETPWKSMNERRFSWENYASNGNCPASHVWLPRGELSLPKIGMQDDWAYVSHFSHINGIDNRYVFKDIKDRSVGDAMMYSEFLRSSYYMLSDLFALCTSWANFMFRTPSSDIQHWRYWSRFVR